MTILTTAVIVSALHIATAAAPHENARAIRPFRPDVTASIRAAMYVHATSMHIGDSAAAVDVGLAASAHSHGPGPWRVSTAGNSRTAGAALWAAGTTLWTAGTAGFRATGSARSRWAATRGSWATTRGRWSPARRWACAPSGGSTGGCLDRWCFDRGSGGWFFRIGGVKTDGICQQQGQQY